MKRILKRAELFRIENFENGCLANEIEKQCRDSSLLIDHASLVIINSVAMSWNKWYRQGNPVDFDPTDTDRKYRGCIIVGPPKSGKTTLMKRLSSIVTSNRVVTWTWRDEDVLYMYIDKSKIVQQLDDFLTTDLATIAADYAYQTYPVEVGLHGMLALQKERIMQDFHEKESRGEQFEPRSDATRSSFWADDIGHSFVLARSKTFETVLHECFRFNIATFVSVSRFRGMPVRFKRWNERVLVMHGTTTSDLVAIYCQCTRLKSYISHDEFVALCRYATASKYSCLMIKVFAHSVQDAFRLIVPCVDSNGTVKDLSAYWKSRVGKRHDSINSSK